MDTGRWTAGIQVERMDGESRFGALPGLVNQRAEIVKSNQFSSTRALSRAGTRTSALWWYSSGVIPPDRAMIGRSFRINSIGRSCWLSSFFLGLPVSGLSQRTSCRRGSLLKWQNWPAPLRLFPRARFTPLAPSWITPRKAGIHCICYLSGLGGGTGNFVGEP